MMRAPWYVDRQALPATGMVAVREQKFTDGSYPEDDKIIAMVPDRLTAEWIAELYNVSLEERGVMGDWIGATGGVATTNVLKPNTPMYDKK